MNPGRLQVLAFAAVMATVVTTCSKKGKDKEHIVLAEFVSEQDSFPRLRYLDSDRVTINDRCAVRKVRLNPKMPAVYVNGQPVGFC